MKFRVAMNLLWCVPGVGGSEEYLVRQLLGLAEIDHEFSLEVFAPKGFAERQPAIANLYVIHEAPSSCLRREIRIALEHTWLAWRTRGFDIVHHGGGSIPRIGNPRTVVTVHDIQWVEYPQYVRSTKLRYLKRMVPSSLRRATRVVVPSHFVAHTLTSAFGTPASRIGVVRHGIEPSMSTDATSEAELRSRFTLGSGPVLVFPAITHPHKNHEFLLRMMAEGNDAWRDQALRVVFAGSAGSQDEAVRALIRSLGLESRVILPGRVSASDRNGLLKMADAMVFPSQYEGFGAPLIEAMRLGAPVLASNCGSIPEVVANAGIVAPLNVDAWNTGLLRIRSERSELINAGMERAREFTTSLSASDLVREYRATLGGGSV